MGEPDTIPAFELFGETHRFPDVIHCERIKDRACEHGWRITAHRHHQMVQLFQIENGFSEVRFDNQDSILQSGEFLYLPAQVVHAFDFRPGTEGLVLSFPSSVVNDIGPVSRQAMQRLSVPIKDRTSSKLASAIALLAQCYSDTGLFRPQVTIGLAHAVLSIVAEHGSLLDDSDEMQDSHRLQKLDTLIAVHMADGWGPGDYASALSISTGHLTRLCRAAMGIATSTYIEAATMTEACRLLAFTRLSIAEVGYRLGYRDPSYFSRRFRVVRGETPSAYRLHLWGHAE